MKLRLIALSAALWAGLVPPAQAEKLMARVTITPDLQRRFQADVVEVDGAFTSLNIAPRELRIRCLQGCATETTYVEGMDDGLLDLLHLKENGRDLVTVWVSGSAYWVRVYHLEDGKIGKVMEAASKVWPSFNFDDQGSLLIGLNIPDESPPTTTWRWNGEVYAPIN
ncbi:hypothetical protein IAI18_00490 [Acetobacteraceae bacterium H6797]|nr:hypothetical protein [Acetobacteraceae bacterium H6797]